MTLLRKAMGSDVRVAFIYSFKICHQQRSHQWLQLSLDCFIATLLKLNATITEKSPTLIMKGVLVYTEVELDSRLL